MTTHTERDARRWSAFERLQADASASQNEREQARVRLEELRSRYGGKPGGNSNTRESWRPWTEGNRESKEERANRYARDFGAWARDFRQWGNDAPDASRWYEDLFGGKRESAEQREKRARDTERARVVARVAYQRERIERIAGWQSSGILRDLHAYASEWSRDDEEAFKAERIRLTGSSRASDL